MDAAKRPYGELELTGLLILGAGAFLWLNGPVKGPYQLAFRLSVMPLGLGLVGLAGYLRKRKLAKESRQEDDQPERDD